MKIPINIILEDDDSYSQVILEDVDEEFDFDDEDLDDEDLVDISDIFKSRLGDIEKSSPESDDESDLKKDDAKSDKKEFEFEEEYEDEIDDRKSEFEKKYDVQILGTIKPINKIIKYSAIKDNKELEKRFKNLFDKVKEYGGINRRADYKNYDLSDIHWEEWLQEDIKEYNLIASELLFGFKTMISSKLYEVDPYAMSKVSIELWPDVKHGDTTVRQRIKELLHGRVNDWASASDDPNMYKELQKLYYLTVKYYNQTDGVGSKSIAINHLRFIKEYSENNSVTSATSNAGRDVSICRVVRKFNPKNQKFENVKNKEIYRLVFLDELNKANAKKVKVKYGKTKFKIITRYVIKHKIAKDKNEVLEVEPILDGDAIKINPPISFAPKSNRRIVKDDASSKEHKVGALNNAISNLFSGVAFELEESKPELIDWSVVGDLKYPIEQYKEMSNKYGSYLAAWKDENLLKLYRMFTEVLSSSSKIYDDKIRPIISEINGIRKLEELLSKYGSEKTRNINWDEIKLKSDWKQIGISEKEVKEDQKLYAKLKPYLGNVYDKEYMRQLMDEKARLQTLANRPPSPNMREWEINFSRGMQYPYRISSPTQNKLPNFSSAPDLYRFKYVGPHPESRPKYTIRPDLYKFEYVGSRPESESKYKIVSANPDTKNWKKVSNKPVSFENWKKVSNKPVNEIMQVEIINKFDELMETMKVLNIKKEEISGKLVDVIEQNQPELEPIISLSEIIESGKIDLDSWNNPDDVEYYLKNSKYFGTHKDYVGELKPEEHVEPEVEDEDEFEVNLDEGFVTCPTTILVDGNPFKLNFGDRLIIDNVNGGNFHQK